VRACVRDIALFFWPLAQIPSATQIRLSHNHLIGPNGATNQQVVDADYEQVQWAGVCHGRPALPLPCLSPAPQGTGSDWKNLPGTAQFLSTQTNRHHVCFNI